MRSQFLTLGQVRFTTDPTLLHSLCTVYLDSLGTPPNPDLKARFQVAAGYSTLDQPLRDLCGLLGRIDLRSIPTRLPDIDGQPASGSRRDSPDSNGAAPPTSAQSLVEPAQHAQNETAARTREEPAPLSRREQPPDAERPAPGDSQRDACQGAPDEAVETSDQPIYLTQRILLDWQAPPDHVSEAQEAVTQFERVLVRFIARQLEAFYGPKWIRRACPMWQKWERRSGQNSASEPSELIGHAHLGELETVIQKNWSLFEKYFESQARVKTAFEVINGLRVGSMHPSDRTIHLLEQVRPLDEMRQLAETFHPETARRIDELYRKAVSSQAVLEPPHDFARNGILTNVDDFDEPLLVGREEELRLMQEFWEEPYKRILCITGAGGVGKTALLDAFTGRLLMGPCPPDQKPDPDVLIYLTAKDREYREYKKAAPESKRFRTLRRIFEATYETIAGEAADQTSIDDLRVLVLDFASSTRILFTLDNLESLDDPDLDAITEFLSDLPKPSKAVITSRVQRKIGRVIPLTGLPPADAKELLLSRLADRDIHLGKVDDPAIEEITRYTGGVPLMLVHCAILIKDYGYSVNEMAAKLTGSKILDLLQFSYDSSLKNLSPEQLKTLLFLAYSHTPRSRKSIMPIVGDSELFKDVVDVLSDRNLIRRVSDSKDAGRFVIDNPQLREYVKNQAQQHLTPQQLSAVQRQARVTPSEAESRNVLIEIDRAMTRANDLARTDRYSAIDHLEEARKRWGDEPRLLGQLGYLYFRVEDRPTARALMERAIQLGSEQPETFAYLALVLLYEQEYGEGVRRAEEALTFKANYPMAEQVAAQCLLAKVETSAFILDEGARRTLLEQARVHAEKSIIRDDGPHWILDHNRRSDSLLGRITSLSAEQR